ncbi:MAG TPA: sulfate permease [Longimicrobiales bacterium]|nr:sulfate permease [Longimicrobiales bacterium]
MLFRPELLATLATYTRAQALHDIAAGAIVGVVALPLSIAFAIATGLPPEYGLYTAIVAGFLISVLGGSRVQIGGPTGAFIVIVYGIVQQHGPGGLAVATLMAGGMLILLGLARLGTAIKFIPYPVTTGFTSGIAIVIFSSQVRDLLGLQVAEVPAEFVAKWQVYAGAFDTINPAAAAVALGTLLVLVGWPRISRTIPAPFVALLLATATVALLGLEVETIGSRFGEIQAGLPRPRLPALSFELLRELSPAAVTIALLAAIESLLSAVVADGMIGTRHDSNTELIAQGVANIAAPIFGGMPATGAIARTATNIRAGGRTPIAGIVHALTLLLITLFFGRWAALIPLAALAAILVVVAYHMSEWRTVRSEITGGPRSDTLVLLATLLLTVFIDLTVAIETGMVLAAFLFMRRMSEVTEVSRVSLEFGTATPGVGERSAPPPGVAVYEINGPFFFGAAEKFKETLGTIDDPPRVLILRMRNVPAIDSTGLNAFRSMVHRFRGDGTLVLLSEVPPQPLAALARSPVLADIGEEHIYPEYAAALAAAAEHVQALTLLHA